CADASKPVNRTGRSGWPHDAGRWESPGSVNGDEVNDAELDLSERPGRTNGLGQALQPVAAHDERIGDAAVAQLGEYAHAKLGAFTTRGADPRAEHIAFAVQVDAHGHVDGPVGDVTVADLDHDGVDQDHRENAIEGPVLPGEHVLDDGVGDP